MPQPRFKAPDDHAFGYYHCVSRVVNRDFRFGAVERERFLRYVQKYSGFTGVRLLSFCILSNHFHLLLEVPKRPEEVSDADLLSAVSHLYSPLRVEELRKQLAALRSAGRVDQAEQLRESYFKRMWDISFFMKELKQRFTQWYNRCEERRGTLWEERFRSVLLESGEALATVAMYVDMNPVRAGITNDPASFEWSAYGRAVAGDRFALAAIERLMTLCGDDAATGSEALDSSENPSSAATIAWYRERLEGHIPMSPAGVARAQYRFAQPLTKDEILDSLLRKGRVEWPEIGLVRNRYFTAAGFLGSTSFVEELFTKHRHRFGPRRKSGARSFRGIRLERLAVLRDLQKDVLEGLSARELAPPHRVNSRE